MHEGLIIARSMGALRRAAAQGQAYYSCEKFEDQYGRLVVGIGARLEGRSLQTVLKLGRKTVLVSPISLQEGMRFRRAVRHVSATESRDAILEMYESFAHMHPRAAKKILGLKPQSEELSHAREVGNYVRRLMMAFNDLQNKDQFTYSKKELMSGFVAGVIHDIGQWGNCSERDHTRRGAQFLRQLVKDSDWIQNLAHLVEMHHNSLFDCGADHMQAAPLILSEAIVEGGYGVLDAMVGQEMVQDIKGLFICACNLESYMPPLCVVRVRNLVGGLRFALAVSLRTEGDVTGSYLLRFAEVDGKGRPRPVSLADSCLIGPGHPDYERGDLEVVDVLSLDIYHRLFEAYEGLIPVYQKMMGQQRTDLQLA